VSLSSLEALKCNMYSLYLLLIPSLLTCQSLLTCLFMLNVPQFLPSFLWVPNISFQCKLFSQDPGRGHGLVFKPEQKIGRVTVTRDIGMEITAYLRLSCFVIGKDEREGGPGVA